jgi:hypothetical protein
MLHTSLEKKKKDFIKRERETTKRRHVYTDLRGENW